MSDIICRFSTPDDSILFEQFRQRLSQGGIPSNLLDYANQSSLPGEDPTHPHTIQRRTLVAVDGDGIHARQYFFRHVMYINGQPNLFVWPTGPISESLIDKKYTIWSVILLKYSLSIIPFHMALGLGSYDNTITRILLALGWRHQKVPFFFMPVHPYRVLRHMGYLKTSRKKHVISNLLAFSGIAVLFLKAYFYYCQFKSSTKTYQVENHSFFGDWADQIWNNNYLFYNAITLRDASALNILYKAGDLRYNRLLVKDGEKNLGWIIVVCKDMKHHAIFGNLRVGTIVDGLCHPDDVIDVMNAGYNFLVKQNVDLVVTNWSHSSWQAASSSLGFLKGPSNFIFCVSKEKSPPLLSDEFPLHTIHLSRGDCDGPVGLV